MLRRFFSYYRPHRRLFIIDFTCAVFVAILELAFPVAVQSFIDKLLPTGNWSMIITVSISLLLFYIISSFMQYVVNYWGHKLGINIETDMRQELFQQYQRQSFKFYNDRKTGHLMSRITNDLMDIGELAHHGPEDLFIAIMTFFGSFFIMLQINVQLALISIFIFPFLLLLILFTNVRMNKAWKRMYAEVAEVNARVEDSVSGVRVVQSFTNEKHEVSLFTKNNLKFRSAKLQGYKVMSFSLSGIYILTRLITLLVLIYGAWMVYQGVLTNGELVAFILYVNLLFKPVDKIAALMEMYPKGMAGFKRFTEMMDLDPDVQNVKNAKAVSNLKGDIRFHDVSFGYTDKQNVLNSISFDIKAGETVAFVGPSGAGKTTISQLIPRFYDVTGGSLTIDGIDVREMTKESLRSQIGIVQQDVFLFTGTLRENIAYGKLTATEEEILEAAHKANLTELIKQLPEGLDTQIGERGLKLSGGQKQRISIARTFLKNPTILILDEATSALDTETEMIIQEALSKLAVNRTTIVIAHRLSTIKKADRIYVVTNEGIAEEGNHQELINQDGIFARLHAAQFH
ncbi:ABC transporter ATP-binding protein [Paenibacillus sp. JCM 10914]|uniref:ABC transporter ATP-binding protein n=1 Tax=Paenibacillus sp. JCM 10914 TaxID=1236974 RepID=UPI0003CC4818|nr:ABC transporter ATP-binding protein [Paenibacillus sp. JCM 10914]GAE06452.1 lipid A export ATP-binding/permease protein MsbA [Paenibacillus sp. JCM 10914]